MGSGCRVKALGFKQESVLTVDLSSTDCAEPRGRVYNGTILHAQFDSIPFRFFSTRAITPHHVRGT